MYDLVLQINEVLTISTEWSVALKRCFVALYYIGRSRLTTAWHENNKCLRCVLLAYVASQYQSFKSHERLTKVTLLVNRVLHDMRNFCKNICDFSVSLWENIYILLMGHCRAVYLNQAERSVGSRLMHIFIYTEFEYHSVIFKPLNRRYRSS